MVFGSDRDGGNDLWLLPIDGGEPQNVTKGRYTIVDEPIQNLGFDGTGSRVWFFHELALYVGQPSAGRFDPFLGRNVVNVDWTRDGKRIVYHTMETGDPIYVHAVDAPRGDSVLVEGPGGHQHFPVWSFDEEWILFVQGNMTTLDMSLWRMRPDGSDASPLTDRQTMVGFPAPIDERTALFTGLDEDGSGPWLWAIDLPTRDVRRVVMGLEQYTSVSASEDGLRIAATVANPTARLWSVPLREDGVATEKDVEPLSGIPTLRALAPRFGKEDLFYLSSRGSGDGLWRLRDGRARAIWSRKNEPLVFLPSISPDGRTVALVRRQPSKRMVLTLLSADSGQVLRVLDERVDVRGSFSWSPNLDAVVIGGIGPEGPGLYRLPVDGSDAELIAGDGAEGVVAKDPVCSPLGDLIVFAGRQTGPMLPLRAVRPDGAEVTLSEERLEIRQGGERIRFLPDGKGLVFIRAAETQDFWHLDVQTGALRRLTNLDQKGDIRRFDVTPDGKRIVFDRIRQNSDVVLFDRRPR